MTHATFAFDKYSTSLHLPRGVSYESYLCDQHDERIEGGGRGGGPFGASSYLLYGSTPLWFYATMVLTVREDQERGEGRFFACRTICRSSSRNKAAAKCVPGYFQQQQATPQWEENETSICQKQETRSKPTPEQE